MSNSGYTFQDVLDIELPEKYLKQFYVKICRMYERQRGRRSATFDFESTRYHVRPVVSSIVSQSYRYDKNFLKLDNATDRAVFAMEFDRTPIQYKILKLWLESIKDMSDLEKTLHGWRQV